MPAEKWNRRKNNVESSRTFDVPQRSTLGVRKKGLTRNCSTGTNKRKWLQVLLNGNSLPCAKSQKLIVHAVCLIVWVGNSSRARYGEVQQQKGKREADASAKSKDEK